MKIALLILILCSIASAQTPSLADVARQERERQKNAKPVVTVTNESLGTAVAPPAPPAPDKAVDKTPAESKTHDEAWWREAFKTAREDAKRAEDHETVVELELNKLNMDYLTRSDLYNKEGQLGPEITAKKAELAAARKAVEETRQKVAQLEEDLRRSGQPAGWSR